MNLESVSPAELIALIIELQGRVEALRRENDELRSQGSRSAAPFSKGKGKENPKRPGRKPGQGIFSRRRAPEAGPDGTDAMETIAVGVEGHSCPDCGGALGESKIEIASTTDVPERPRPVVRRYEVEVRECGRCGRKVRGRHADLVPDQYGATAHRFGPRLKATAQVLHYAMGVPVRKVPAILKELTGIEATPSALTQDALKQASRSAGGVYRELRDNVREAPVVHTDDTGWRMGGNAAQSTVFDTDRETVYQIRNRHRNEEVRELIPSGYTGVMVTDRGKSYDAEEFGGVAQQKCLSHLLRNAHAVLKEKRGPARRFGVKLKGLLREGLQLWHGRKDGKTPDDTAEAERIERDPTHHLRHRVLRDEDNRRLLDNIGWRNDRGNVLRFLHQPGVEPTNNRAERALRPAVIARKVSHCSKNRRGAEAFAVFTTLAQTFRKRIGISLIDTFTTLFKQRCSPFAS